MTGHDLSHGVSRVVHHKDYYLRGGDLTVLVENHLYRIHSYFFDRESLFFRQKFNSAHNNGEQEGSNDHNAYTLEDVKSEDFARFLWIFYNPKYSIYEAPLETWLSILKLANRWTFDSIKELSVRELEKIEIEPVEKIAIYHDNTISRLYLIPSYIAVCKRDKPLTFSEGMKLGMETVLRIAEARERLRLQASESGIRTPTFEDIEDAEVEVLVREIFNLGVRATSPNSITSPTHGVNGTPSNTIKLNPAPPGNPPKANGAHAPRANGGSAADPRGASVNALPSFTTVMSPSSHQSDTTTKPPPTGALPTTTPPTAPRTATPTTATPQTATQGPQAPVPPAKPGRAPTPPPLTTAKGKDPKEDPRDLNNRLSGLVSPKPGGAAAHSTLPQAEAPSAGSRDVLISEPVVQPSDPNDNVTEPNGNVHDAENEQSSKDNDNASVFSETEGSAKAGKQAGKKNNNRGGKAARNGRKN